MGFRYPRLKLTNKLQDSNVLVCHRSVLELLQKKRKLESLSKGFLPWLCKINHRRSKKEAYKTRVLSFLISTLAPGAYLSRPVLQSHRKMPTLANALKHSTLNEPGTVTYKEEDDGRITTNHGPSTRVGLTVHKAGDGIAARANNLYSYLDINRRVRKETPQPAAADSPDLVSGPSSSEPNRGSSKGTAY